MNELRCKILVIGGGPGGYVGGNPRRPVWPRHDPRRSRSAGRDVPQCRLHSLEGADPRGGRGACPSRAAGARRNWAFDWPAHARLRPHHRLEGFDRHTTDQRRRHAAEKGRRAHAPGDGDDRRRQDRDHQRRHRREPHRQPSTLSSRPARSRSTLPALPFGGDILSSTDALALTEVPRIAGPWSAPAISGWSLASPSPSSAPR